MSTCDRSTVLAVRDRIAWKTFRGGVPAAPLFQAEGAPPQLLSTSPEGILDFL